MIGIILLDPIEKRSLTDKNKCEILQFPPNHKTASMSKNGWFRLLEGYPWHLGENKYPLRAYSEYMPPVRIGISPYDGTIDQRVLDPSDPYGWLISEFEEEYQLRPGLEQTG